MSVLVTGVAGFLGLHVAEALLARGEAVLGIDDLNAAYDPALKEARLRRLLGRERFGFVRGDVGDPAFLDGWATQHGGDVTGVVHLAAGRSRKHPSHPREEVHQRIAGHLVLLALCRHRLPQLRHLVHAESGLPLPEDSDGTAGARRRKALRDAEIILGRAYARLYRIPQTCIRLARVYGPWSRPDALCQALADAIAAGRPLLLPEGGQVVRLAFVEDVAAAIVSALDDPPDPRSGTPYRLLDLAATEPVEMARLVSLLEDELGQVVEKRWGPAPPGAAAAALDDGAAAPDRRPATRIEEGIARFVVWHRKHYGRTLEEGRAAPL
ncbi:NAD-dependent epimerase/dehydratase family protein [Benzoatithermus flavus]|uniref:NAD-dependent epimerase/dehydratase family protein n=1 Tax=Benzoatithermus flavus TaxID=3108223 RepID=A0ABU8XQI1_9PROT